MSKYLLRLYVLLSISYAPLVYAETADDAIALVKKTKEYLKKEGIDKTCTALADPAAGFQKGELYASVLDMREPGRLVMVCNGKNPRINGKDLIEQRDINSVYISKEMVKVINTKGKGWVDYHWVHPVTGTLAPKSSYVERQDGYMVIAGIYKK